MRFILAIILLITPIACSDDTEEVLDAAVDVAADVEIVDEAAVDAEPVEDIFIEEDAEEVIDAEPESD